MPNIKRAGWVDGGAVMDHVECVVAGAGVVGLAVARALARAGREVLVIDAAKELGQGTSGRGSGVIHAGLYYPTGSLKARLCIAGRSALYTFAEASGVPCKRTGKLVVATSAADDQALAAIAAQAKINGVSDLESLDAEAAAALEPALVCTSALLSPSTGVIDVTELLHALRADAEEFGAVTAFQAPLVAAVTSSTGFTLEIGGATPMRLGCRYLVNAAGHGAPAVARATNGLPAKHVPHGHLAKGNYFRSSEPVPFSRLIYPVPVPGGVGTHLTIDPAGAARFGPDVEWIDTLDYTVDPSRAESFYADIRRWWPGLPDGALLPDYAGIRPKISGPGERARDFMIEGEGDHGVRGLVNLFGIESPGVTASLAIADHVRALLTHDAPPSPPSPSQLSLS